MLKRWKQANSSHGNAGFLALNEIELDIDDYALYGITMSVANHEASENSVKEYLIQHTV